MTAVKGCDFDNAFKLSENPTEGKLPIRLIDLNNLKDAKKAVGRYKDLDDPEKLSDKL